jgi:hypothetical protein
MKFRDLIKYENYFQIQYEEIINDSVKAFQKICDFIGVEHCANLGAGAHDKSLESWKTDPYYTLQLADAVKQTAKELGYSDTELNHPPKPKPPFLWRMNRVIVGNFHLGLARIGYRVIKPIRLRLKNASK